MINHTMQAPRFFLGFPVLAGGFALGGFSLGGFTSGCFSDGGIDGAGGSDFAGEGGGLEGAEGWLAIAGGVDSPKAAGGGGAGCSA